MKALKHERKMYILAFTTHGMVFSLGMEQIPNTKRSGKGKNISKIIDQIDPGGKIVSLLMVDFNDNDIENQFIIMLTRNGMIVRVPVSEYKYVSNEGMIAVPIEPDDELCCVTMSKSLSMTWFFTKHGFIYNCWAEEIPENGKLSSFTNLRDILGERLMKDDDPISVVLSVDGLDEGLYKNRYVCFATHNGVVKRGDLESIVHTNGGRCISMDEEDWLVSVVVSDGESNLMICTNEGWAIRFDENAVRVMPRRSGGVRGIMPQEKDGVLKIFKVNDSEEWINKHRYLTLTENGFIRMTTLDFFGNTSNRRGVKGTKYYNTDEESGKVLDGTVFLLN